MFFRSLFLSPCSQFPALLSFRQDAWLFRRAQAHHAVDGVGRGVLAGEVVAHLKLTEQADGQQLNAGDD